MTSSRALVGTAFDYALRFELQRRLPHCIARGWVADNALAHDALTRKQRALARSIHRSAVVAVEAYKSLAESSRLDREKIAACALQLAKLDGVYRSGFVDDDLEKVDLANVQDVVALLGAVPFERLSHPRVMLLNPTFGTYSELVLGADGDLIIGDALIDVKTVKDATITKAHLRQLLGYFILARGARRQDSSFPEIRRLAVYLARHGHLWTAPTVDFVVDDNRFAMMEEWFIKEARSWIRGTQTGDMFDIGRELFEEGAPKSARTRKKRSARRKAPARKARVAKRTKGTTRRVAKKK